MGDPRIDALHGSWGRRCFHERLIPDMLSGTVSVVRDIEDGPKISQVAIQKYVLLRPGLQARSWSIFKLHPCTPAGLASSIP